MADIRTLKLALLADTKDFIAGLDKADKETKSFSNKLDDALKVGAAAFLAVGAAAATMAIKIGVDAVKAAIADEKAQVSLATTLRNTTKATDSQVKAVEDYIDKTARAKGVTDDQLRPSLDRLVRSTEDITKAQKLQTLALDIAAGTGKDLATVSEALGKAYDGNLGALKRIGVPLDENIIKTKDFDAATRALSETFAGQADAAANTFAGRMARLSISLDEAKEKLGTALLEPLSKVAEFLAGPMADAVTGLVDGLTRSGKQSLTRAFYDVGTGAVTFGYDMTTAEGSAYALGEQLRDLADATASLLQIDPQTGESLLIKLIDSFTTLLEKIEAAIASYERFKSSFLGGAFLDVANLANPAVLAGRFATGGAGNLIKAPNTTNYFNIKGAIDPQATARAIVKVQTTATKTTGIKPFIPGR
jgi:hypothetical protein